MECAACCESPKEEAASIGVYTLVVGAILDGTLTVWQPLAICQSAVTLWQRNELFEVAFILL